MHSVMSVVESLFALCMLKVVNYYFLLAITSNDIPRQGDSGLAAFWGLLGGEGPIASASRCVVGLRQDDSSFVAILGG